LRRLWLPGLLAASLCALASLAVGQLPILHQPSAPTLGPPIERPDDLEAAEASEPPPAFEIEVAAPENLPPPVMFGMVVGLGAAPAPVWIGPTPDAAPALQPDEPSPVPVADPPILEPVVGFRMPIPGPAEAGDDGVALSLIERSTVPIPVPEPRMPASAPPAKAAPARVAPPAWPPSNVHAAVYRRLASNTATAPAAQPVGARIGELMIWPLRLLTQPFRELRESLQ
jgi:hypothetical protein